MDKKHIFVLLLCIFLSFFNHSEASIVNCEYPEVALVDSNLVGPLSQISQMAIFNLLKDCILTAANASWETVKGMGNCIAHPIDCAESAVEGVRNAYGFIQNLSVEVKKILGNMSSLQPRQIGELICSVVGTLAPVVLMAILTAGAASGKLGVTIAKIMLKIGKIMSILSYGVTIPIRLLGKMSDSALENIMKVFQYGNKKQFENDMKGLGCAISS